MLNRSQEKKKDEERLDGDESVKDKKDKKKKVCTVQQLLQYLRRTIPRAPHQSSGLPQACCGTWSETCGASPPVCPVPRRGLCQQ